MNKKNKQHKKCGAKIAGKPACRHTAKSNGRCQAHSSLAIPLKLKKEAERKLAKRVLIQNKKRAMEARINDEKKNEA